MTLLFRLDVAALAAVAVGAIALSLVVAGGGIRQPPNLGGLLAMALVAIPLFGHGLISNPHLAANGSTIVDIGDWA